MARLEWFFQQHYSSNTRMRCKEIREFLNFSGREVEEVLDDLCVCGEYQPIYYLWSPLLPGAKDDYILELAVAPGVDTIVTHNTKHFPGIAPFGVRAVMPKQLLEEIS